MNFLEQLFQPRSSPTMPFNPAQSPMQPPAQPQSVMGGDLAAMLGGAQGNLPSNILETIQNASQPASAPPIQDIQQQSETPRKRRSFLDTVGQISDVLARVGGAEALYQPTLDAREDRTRAIDLEEMRKQQLQQQIDQGGQTLEAGNIELEDTERSRLAQALGAVASNPDAAALWPQIAAEAGIDEGRAQQIGAIIQANPQAAGIFAQSLGWSPTAAKSGSQAKELQVYGLLQEQNPELAAAYLANIANPDSITDYQRAQLGIALEQLNLSREDKEFDREIKTREVEADEAKAATGGVDLTPTQRGNVVQKLKLLPNVRTQYERVRTLYNEMIEEGTLSRGALGGLVPGAIAGGKAEQFDKAAGALRKSILSLTRIPGVGSMSNYETVLDEQALPSRWGSDAGRLEAINGIGTILDSYEAGYKDMLGNPAPARAPARTPPPRRRSSSSGARPAATRRSVSPAAAEARRRGLID